MDDEIELGEDALDFDNSLELAGENTTGLCKPLKRVIPVLGSFVMDTESDGSDEDTYAPEELKTYEDDEVANNRYTREEMVRIQDGEGISWQHDDEEDSLAVMTHWLHDERRKGSQVRSEEYWIWHNTNAQNTFAQHFGFFPLYLVHFDTAGFAEAAKEESPVLRYLRNGLFKEHLKLHEGCKGPLTLEERTNCERIMDLECPLDGYSREQVVALGNSKQAPNKNLCTFLDKKAFAFFRYENNERVYSRGHMLMLAGYPDYHWHAWNDDPDYSGLRIMERHFPGSQRKKKMASTDYWIWHNVNGQQSFAMYYGFFPFHLPHFDAESFISVARQESLVSDYLISRLYQHHLILREDKERVPYHKEKEDVHRKKMIAAYQSVKKFPLTDEHSVVYYEDSERNLQECSLEQAMDGLRAGLFTSEMKFAVAPKGENVRDKEWMVFELGDLIARNGKAMPFLFYLPSHTENMNEVEEVNQIRKEMFDLTRRRSTVALQIQQLARRHAAAQEDMQRIAEKYPMLAYRSAQTNATMGLAAKVDAFEPSHPQFVPKLGVDAFAMLKLPKDSMNRKEDDVAEIANNLELLRNRFDQCDKKSLVLRTTNMISKSHPTWCHLCDLKMESASTFVEHITCRKHVNKLTAICLNSLEFWFIAIDEVTKGSVGPKTSPLTILSFCSKLANPHPSLEQAAATMRHKLNHCDKKVLDGEPELRALFISPVTCSVCIRRVSIDKPANLISHFTTHAHLTAATRVGGQMHADVIDFWMKALDRATVARTNY